MARTRPKTTREKVQAYRDRLRRQGLRALQIWVPDVRSSAFKKAAQRQSLAVARSARAKEDQDFIESILEG